MTAIQHRDVGRMSAVFPRGCGHVGAGEQKTPAKRGGGEGIRTPETLRPAGFQDRCDQPDSATPPREAFAA